MIYIVIVVTTISLFLIKKYFNGGRYLGPETSLKGKYAVVTGGNSGIGAETVKTLSKLGCQVLIGARDRKTAQQLLKQIKQLGYEGKVKFQPLDLGSKQSIQQFVKKVDYPHIDYLVNNAGIMAIPVKKTIYDGVEMQWGVNHLGHFYLTYHLWHKLKASNFFRIINVSSLAHKRLLGFGGAPNTDFQNINFDKKYDPNVAYSRSKLYNVLFTLGLAQKIQNNKGVVVSLHPGVVRTALMRQMKKSLLGLMAHILTRLLYPIYWLFTKDSEQGAQTTIFTLLGEVQNGEYYADCKKDTMNKHAKNKKNIDELWSISQNILGIKFKI